MLQLRVRVAQSSDYEVRVPVCCCIVSAMLRQRILDADPTLTVADIVSPAVLRRINARWAIPFAQMRIEWTPNRAWGLSFKIGDPIVRVGHKRGHHIAQHPDVHGISPELATEVVRLEVEGTLLHELGHALFDVHRAADPTVTQAFQMAMQRHGPVSSYQGMDVTSMSEDDVLHENVAEAVRWSLMGNHAFTRKYPLWCLFAGYLTMSS